MAGDAIIAGGGTISHHHGVGTDHQPWLPADRGQFEIEMLRSIKGFLDPAGLANPEVLIAGAPPLGVNISKV